MFAISSFQYITLAFVFSKGAPYRKPIWSNLPFCLSLVINLSIVIYMVIYPSDWLANFFQLVMPPVMDFRYWMLVYGVALFVTHVLLEVFVVEFFLFKKIQVRRMQTNNKRKHMKIEYDLKHCLNWPVITHTEALEIEATELEATPIYVEMRAGQKLQMPVPQNTSLFGFFEETPITTPLPTLQEATVENVTGEGTGRNEGPPINFS